MRLLLQRVQHAKVTVDDEIVGAIGPGILAFLGVHKDDHEGQVPWMVNKLLNLRVFSDEQGKMNLSVQDRQGEILVVSQFTLYGNCRNGRRPDFIQSAKGEQARHLYEAFVAELRKSWGRVETGRFAAMMEIELLNDGPVTLIVDSKGDNG